LEAMVFDSRQRFQIVQQQTMCGNGTKVRVLE
jgi:hypothetical protein